MLDAARGSALASILVIGAGAIGGLLAARLALAGHSVAVVARGAHLEAMRDRGHIMLEWPDHREQTPVAAYAEVDSAPDAEIVFVTLKAYQLPALAAPIARKARRASAFVPIQNGIPWWLFAGTNKANTHAGCVVRAVDPEGALMTAFRGVPLAPAYATVAAEVIAPGTIRHQRSAEDSFPIGALDDAALPAAALAADALTSTGFSAPRIDVRQWVWIKLLGNIWANPIGALTGATVAQVATDPASRPIALALMSETQAVARAFGVEPGIDFERRLERAVRLRQGTKASMLQDIERGRATERDAILGALVELADLVGIAVPHVRTLLACLTLREAHGPQNRSASTQK